MDDATHTFWQSYIHDIADLVRLRDWDIVLTRKPPENDSAGASNATFYGRKYAEIQLSAEFFAMTPRQQRHIVAHELLHCHFENQWESVRLHPLEDAYFWAVFKRETELLIDTMAVVVCEFLPLPDEA